ncbi:MAG: calcium/proton exchanger [Chloroflexi bacterium]|nr:MAG: calcium/proton exchanger [Chloroflexota bacterium]
MAGRRSKLHFSGENRLMAGLLVLVPLTLLAAAAGVPRAVQFFLAVGAVVPLAAYISAATDALAIRLGGKVGGLLNATFGNFPDLLIGVFGVQKGLIPLVKATLVGALISNSALILGLCYLAAGLLYRRPRFDRLEAGRHSILMMLTVAAVLFPSATALVVCRGACSGPSAGTIQGISVGIAIVLLISYGAYVAYGVLGLEGEGRDDRQRPWPTGFSLAVLGTMAVALIPVTDILTGGVTAVTQVLGWTQVFVGVIIVANAGNVAEAYAAIKFALKRPGGAGRDSGLDLSLGVASASSIQIATFVAPVVVLFSLTAHPMNLVFSFVEISILALLAVIFTHTAQDGESNWLEGVQLLALYAMAAIVFYALPESALGG